MHRNLSDSRRTRQLLVLRSRARRRQAAKSHRRATVLGLATMLVFGVAATGANRYDYYAGDLPDATHLNPANLSQATSIVDRKGRLLYLKHGPEIRTVEPLSRIALWLRKATIDVEDKDFYTHHGLDYPRLLAAAYADLTHTGVQQGASTITQQLVKAFFLTPERTIDRKIKEALLSGAVEDQYTKDQILAAYLNEIPYGHQTNGIEAASELYFGIHAAQLDLAQASFLAGIPRAPSDYDPLTPDGFANARARQHEVLAAMVNQGDVSPGLAADTEAAGIKLDPQMADQVLVAPHFVEYVINYLHTLFPASLVDGGGLRVTTSLDLDLQHQAESIVRKEVGSFAAGGVNNGAMVALDAKTGGILAYVGSADYFNNAIDGQFDNIDGLGLPGYIGRQPGSSFKPYVYLTALADGYTLDSVITDQVGVIGGTKFTNFDDKSEGPITLRQALVRSRNIPTIALLQDLGYQRVFQTARMLGITTNLKPELGSAIGTSEVRMLEHAGAYTAFATEGTYNAPSPVLKVEDQNGKVLYQLKDHGRRVISPQVAYLLDDILLGYAKQWNLNLVGPAAGKSGTTDDHADLWYMGYTPDLVVGTWMAHTGHNPDGTSIGRFKLDFNYFGVSTAALMFRDFLPVYYNGKPIPTFARPAGVVNGGTCHTNLTPVAPTGGPVGENQPQQFQPTVECSGGDLHIEGTTPHPALKATYSPPGTYVIPPGR